MLNIFYIVLILYLSFMYVMNQTILLKVVKGNRRRVEIFQQNYFVLWFIFVLAFLFILLPFLSIPTFLPNKLISITDFLLFCLLLIPFITSSDYQPHKSLKGIIAFCIVFPIGEELIFRGIIPSMVNQMLGNTIILIPFPLLKEISLAVLIAALLFSIMHLQYFQFKINKETLIKLIYALIFGVFIGNLVEITDSLFYAILFHILANSGATYMFLKRHQKIR
jgi:uncharacterized protein